MNPYKTWLNRTLGGVLPINPTSQVSLGSILEHDLKVEPSGLTRWQGKNQTFGALRLHDDGTFSLYVGRYHTDPAGIDTLLDVFHEPRRNFSAIVGKLSEFN